ncbi:AAEL006059-PA [Aedes aegypti]|uniref:AAEL006059-PA n=2 Tax=Aedes aegypti TaxID=7159 RepID=A0A1S4FCB5_AEDAE|nr:uncharacterized protein LOC5567390 [Aedes aegypti]EAT42410.1 AAEL006059-PA [Aedes aegypti]
MIQSRIASVLTRRIKQFYPIRSVLTSPAYHQHAKEILKIVDPYSKIKIRCNCALKIVPYDLLDCPDSNLLKASVNSEKDHNLNVEISGNEVSISDSSAPSSPVSCILEIPIKADLEVLNNGSTAVFDLYSDEIRIESGGNVDTKNLRCTLIDLRSADGNISCAGTTLAQIIKVVTSGTGNVALEKLQGGEVEVESNEGDISVTSSYSNNSSFRTNGGNLLLKSIHKNCQVVSNGPGKFVMNGFYGTLNANAASREVSLQLSETVGECTVTARSATTVDLAISDTVLENTEVHVTCDQLEVHPDMAGDQHAELDEAGQVSFGKKGSGNKLNVHATGLVTMKKMSWTDSFGFAFKDE